ncbi:uncharacterized protein LOC135134327 [Zophobas morio]
MKFHSILKANTLFFYNRILNSANSTKMFFLIYQISVSVCTVQDNLNFYNIFDTTNPVPSVQNTAKTEDKTYDDALYKSAYRDNTERFFKMEGLDNEGHFGLDSVKVPSPQNSAFGDFLDTMCSEINTNDHESVRQDTYDFFSENKWYLHGGIGAFGVSAITFIVMVYRKWRQKKINSENGNFPSVDNQNSQEDKIVVNTEENKQSEGRPQACNTNDTVLLISL